MSRVVEGLVLVPQRQLRTNQTFSGMTSVMVTVSSGIGMEFSRTVIAALPVALSGLVLGRILVGM